jgi:hypothetical protein
MNKKSMWMTVGLTVLVTLVVVWGINEMMKSNHRKVAIQQLNATWPSLKDDSSKTAALVKTNTILADNKSMFSFSNSKAAEDKDPEEYGGGISNWRPELFGSATVSSGWVWQDPSGNWHQGQ